MTGTGLTGLTPTGFTAMGATGATPMGLTAIGAMGATSGATTPMGLTAIGAMGAPSGATTPMGLTAIGGMGEPSGATTPMGLTAIGGMGASVSTTCTGVGTISSATTAGPTATGLTSAAAWLMFRMIWTRGAAAANYRTDKCCEDTMLFLPLSLIAVGLLLAWYLIGKRNESYWKKRGVKFYSKNKVAGPFWDFLTSQRALFEILGDLYKQHRQEPAIGIGQFLTPALFVIDPKNVQQVLSGDFQSFHHRGLETIEGDQLSDNIIMMNGPRWKLMRQNMTPLFTANKLKNMYYILDKSAQDFVQYLKNNPKTRDGNFFETLMLFCNAAVCGAIFGIGTNSIFDTPFLKVAKSLSQSNLSIRLKFILANLSPKLFKLLGLKVFNEYEDFFIGSISKVMKAREQEKVKRHDFADIALAIQKNGTMRDRTTGYEIEPTTGILSAQALFFFTAGVEPCANAIFSTLILLSSHPEILERVHQEIDEHFEKYSNNITYDVICEMKYIDKVLSEAMRIFPPIGQLTRQCVQNTVLPVGNIPVEKGTKMFTPIYAIHHDPELYPDPEVFDPERFSKDRRPNDDIYMPFGMGNRTCIGERYAKLQVQAGLVHVLRNFTVKPQKHQEVIFAHDALNVRPRNVDVQLIPRNI